jgi:hypothetical protein
MDAPTPAVRAGAYLRCTDFSFTIPYNFFTNPQSGFTPVVGQWYHLAGVYDANAQSMFSQKKGKNR